jgi:hypothetical protein
LDIKNQISGPNCISALNTRENMASVLVKQKKYEKYEKALEIYLEVWEMKKQILGPGDPSTLHSKKNIESILRKKGEFDKHRESIRRHWI